MRRGLLRKGDKVQLTDPRGKLFTITLAAGTQFHTHRGYFSHDDIIGRPEGSVVRSTAGTEYLVLRPLLSDYVLSMPRGAQVSTRRTPARSSPWPTSTPARGSWRPASVRVR